MNIKLSILQVLQLSDPFRMPKNALRSELETRHGGRIGDDEFTEAIKALQAKGLIDYTVDDLTANTRYHITSAGKARLEH